MNAARSLTVDYQNEEYVVVDEIRDNHLIRHESDVMFVNGLAVLPGISGNISIGSSRGFEQPFYFQLPAQFLGDHIVSYSGYLRFVVSMEECKTELDDSILRNFPVVQIHAHDNLILNYFGVSFAA